MGDLSELVVFIVLAGLAGLTLAGLAAAWWAMRARRIAWERYMQERERIDQGTRIVPRPPRKMPERVEYGHIKPTTPWPKQ